MFTFLSPALQAEAIHLTWLCYSAESCMKVMQINSSVTTPSTLYKTTLFAIEEVRCKGYVQTCFLCVIANRFKFGMPVEVKRNYSNHQEYHFSFLFFF